MMEPRNPYDAYQGPESPDETTIKDSIPIEVEFSATVRVQGDHLEVLSNDLESLILETLDSRTDYTDKNTEEFFIDDPYLGLYEDEEVEGHYPDYYDLDEGLISIIWNQLPYQGTYKIKGTATLYYDVEVTRYYYGGNRRDEEATTDSKFEWDFNESKSRIDSFDAEEVK